MEEHDRILICRNSTNHGWSNVSNPQWDHFTKAASAILQNDVNDYVEWANCSVAYRLIRRRDTEEYSIPHDVVGLICTSGSQL